LYLAAENGYEAVVQLLLKHMVDVVSTFGFLIELC
jgi:hypothetical protein